MKGYKGFDKDLKCCGKQYTVGKTAAEECADLYNSGLHFCENPLDCFAYYPPADSRYCEVDAEEVSEQKDGDSKRVAKKLTIGAEIGLDGIIKAGVKFILEKASETGDIDKCTGDWSAATNTGYRSAATNTGDWSAASVSGKNSVAIATGIGGKAKGAFGCATVLCDYDDDGSLLHIASQIVDGRIIKPDTYYTLKNGVFVVAEGES